MPPDRPPLADIAFAAEVIQWRGPAPFFFVAVPTEHVDEVRYAARLASYGWGVVPVQAVVQGVPFGTSLFPKADGYLLPLRNAVRKAATIGLGDIVAVQIRIEANDGSRRRPGTGWPPRAGRKSASTHSFEPDRPCLCIRRR